LKDLNIIFEREDRGLVLRISESSLKF